MLGLRRLTWILVGLFLLFGIIMLVADSAGWRRFWAGLSVLSVGAFAVSMARDALFSGQIPLRSIVLRYARQPRLFWAAVILIAAVGVAVMIAGLWLLFVGPLVPADRAAAVGAGVLILP